MARVYRVFVLVILLAVASACGGSGSPTGPGPGQVTEVTLDPSNVEVAATAKQRFTATGGDGNYTWSLPDGGGVIESFTGITSFINVVAGNTPGKYRVVSNSGGKTAQAFFEVKAQYELEFVSANPPIGSELIAGTNIRFKFRYVTLKQPVVFDVWLLDANRVRPLGSSNAQTISNSSGMGFAEAVTTTTVRGETKFIRAMLREGSNILFELEMEAPYTWK
jgi:hypothetical protein